ncbi:glycerate kinase [Cryobacterium sp. TMT1-21]|uniref:Glycerate kinase n=1 Tax=Cryobacterium shii TaxID=1259235 RepID=A0AAQ2C7T0_9MICO|nr:MULTISPECIES: glycerate kinase [Cryobacterium]TFC50714.1 glycerate kinase [Cryobacterium shii]TFC82811.1 glycerate kinase [Cryobacterium sp. TmT2-59]TFD10639.1 glycerate kinase [Cryobacterium sp. TMT1-21]TFD12529.1 glycerate kinase [Cryobacterium sp. TMT4-10]TFD16689.1 glycerate kinase [Cryobacterium sp. TMT2-23]
MKFVLAPDSFKESMSAAEAVAAMERGIRTVFPDAECVGLPMADGGEGTVDALVAARGGALIVAKALDALGRPRVARYGYVADERLAIIEIAAAAGIQLIDPADRDPRNASTFGVGQLITDALDRGARRFVIGLGGSATTDGGAGMLHALGARLLDANGRDLPGGGAALARLARIDLAGFDPRLFDATFEIASDVTNPLLGAEGAAAVFGPQKGADEVMVRELDAALTVYARVLAETTGYDVAGESGAGAAGGLGAAFLGCFDCRMRRGIEVVMQAAGLAVRLDGADYVFTGEGSVDAQTLRGKAPLGVAEVAARADVPVIAFAGRIGDGAEALYDHGFSVLVPIVAGISDLSQALRDGPRNLERAVATVCRLLALRASGSARPGGGASGDPLGTDEPAAR